MLGHFQMDNKHQSLLTFLRALENKNCKLVTSRGFRYDVHDLTIEGEYIFFKDRYGNNVMLPVKDIAAIQEDNR